MAFDIKAYQKEYREMHQELIKENRKRHTIIKKIFYRFCLWCEKALTTKDYGCWYHARCRKYKRQFVEDGGLVA